MSIVYSVFVCVDCVLEALSAAILILANLYCAKLHFLPRLKFKINYCKLKNNHYGKYFVKSILSNWYIITYKPFEIILTHINF